MVSGSKLDPYARGVEAARPMPREVGVCASRRFGRGAGLRLPLYGVASYRFGRGSTGWSIAEGDTFTLTFDSVEDLNDNEGAGMGLQYDVSLFAIDSGATRNGNCGGTGWTQLENLVGSVTQGDTSWTTDITLSYTVTGNDSAIFGQEIAVGFIDSWTGNTTGLSSSMIDNVSLDAEAVPEPSTFALLSCFGLMWVLRRRR